MKSWAGLNHMALRCRMEEPLVKDFMQVDMCSVLESWLRPRHGWWGGEVGRTVCPETSGRLSPWEEGKVSGHSKSRRGHPRRTGVSGRHWSEISLAPAAGLQGLAFGTNAKDSGSPRIPEGPHPDPGPELDSTSITHVLLCLAVMGRPACLWKL